MRIRRLEIENFRGITSGEVVFQEHTLLVGGNNIGKSTVCEALELVLGPERLYRRPVIDEHDFSHGRYLDSDGQPQEICIRAVLTDLSDEQRRRFMQHLRRWDDKSLEFIDTEPDSLQSADNDHVIWALPVVFIGRYDKEEDDFVGDTFFDHPLPELDELDDEDRASLGSGRARFSSKHKRVCGFIFLRALRTGSRALSLQRGSLLDTILRLGGEGAAEMWRNALGALQDLDPAIGEIEQLKVIRDNIRARLGQFVNLAPGEDSAAFFASDLTREHLREVVRLFVATQPSSHSVPFAKQGTGSVNMLVFALLTIIADLKGDQSVIFVMEEPEIALPPHTQRRVTKYVVQQMGQSIVTSHSPYVIEQFAPDNVVILSRDGETLSGAPIDTTSVKPKTYRTQRRQFSEAILSRAVFVLEGQTEMVAVHAVSSALEQFRNDYSHIDLAGVSLFNAGNDRAVPGFAPMFKALGKRVYGMRDKLNAPDAADAIENIKLFDGFWESPETGIEEILVKEVPTYVLRNFLDEVVQRDDYPTSHPYVAEKVTDHDLPALAIKVLKARKGDAFGFGYTDIFVGQCQTEADLPDFIRDALLAINEQLQDEPELILDDAVTPGASTAEPGE
ncbi:AAA family ATPase [Nesterenkonia sp. MY13]|uniref:AAA family ATPase n=1 Tax=Nesterenkonia sedimenti TaxID=1463632 RepID=A0A7X8THR0_9MICC|nr:AAA family ATPase [Nesterenkonia sedimenti]NLS08640.1 AAA family ATPase [Nesterenkonia sedimenti]